MKKKGFTLIELLAVIVILAIIALIATPIILNVIEDAKKSAAVDSAYGYIEAIEFNNAMADVNEKYKGKNIITDETLESVNLKINVKGNKATKLSLLVITDGKVTSAQMCIGGYNVIYENGKAEEKGKCEKNSSEQELNVVAKGYDGIYDGENHGITVECEGTTIKYGTEEGNYSLDSSPTYKDVGRYVVYYQVSKTGYKTVTGSIIINITNYKEEILNGTGPVLSDNLIPVTIANDGTVKKADLATEWYNYGSKKWANAVILVDETKTYSKGTTIPASNIESYFVWIPRYKYQIFDLGSYTESAGSSKPTTSNAKEIQIVFGTETTNDSKNGECKTPGVSGESGNCKVGDYMTHPAFLAFNTNGFWVGKFETTGSTTNLTIKPGSASIKNINLKTMFDAAYNYKRDNESHMMKNTEWGAVAYLSHSKYGINKEVNINNFSGYMTGYSAVEAPTCFTTAYSTCNKIGTGTGVTLPYNNTTGYKASTTGNITGVYDTSGGALEYVAAYKSGVLGSSGFTTDPVSTYGEKYFDKYSVNSNSWASFNNRILGDATGEMGPFYHYNSGDGTSRYHNSWYADISNFVLDDGSWFIRGGYFGNGSTGSQFYFASPTTNGGSADSVGFRMVLTK